MLDNKSIWDNILLLRHNKKSLNFLYKIHELVEMKETYTYLLLIHQNFLDQDRPLFLLA